MRIETEIVNLKKRVEMLEKIILKNNITLESFSLSEEKPEDISTLRDKTKYLYKGKVYAKNRIVLQIIKDYVEKYNPSFEVLQNTFDKSLQGSRNVVETYKNASALYDGSKRYFMKPNEILNLLDGTKTVVCNQWSKFNIQLFIDRASSLGFEVQAINQITL